MRPPRASSTAGFKRIDALMLLAFLIFLVALFGPRFLRDRENARTAALQEGCRGNLQRISQAFTSWSQDHAGELPMARAVTNGGVRELVAEGNPLPAFRALSNEVRDVRAFVCPDDAHTQAATSFADFSRTNVSYFVSVDAVISKPGDFPLGAAFLAGDRHLTNGRPAGPGLFELNTNRPAGWTWEIHSNRFQPSGCVALCDGSAAPFSAVAINCWWGASGVTTYRLAMP